MEWIPAWNRVSCVYLKFHEVLLLLLDGCYQWVVKKPETIFKVTERSIDDILSWRDATHGIRKQFPPKNVARRLVIWRPKLSRHGSINARTSDKLFSTILNLFSFYSCLMLKAHSNYCDLLSNTESIWQIGCHFVTCALRSTPYCTWEQWGVLS